MSSDFKHNTAIIVSKLTENLVRKLNIGSGTSLPGMIARKISPNILSNLVNQTKKEIIVVTGTNGKTTTSGLLAGILKQSGRKTAHNKKGANMLTGLTTAIISESSLQGKLNADNCLMEIDEAYFYKAVGEFNPDLLLVTNLFRDQLDRYGELDSTAKKIQAAIDKTTQKKQLKLILNADDPMVATLGNNDAQKIHYGFEEIHFINQDETVKSPQEVCNCSCGEKYKYEKVYYGHLGHYSCSCGKIRPEPSLIAKAYIEDSSSKITLSSEKTGAFEVTLKMPGLYNAYNALGAITLAIELGIDINYIKQGLETYDTVFGRTEFKHLNGKPTLIQLIKNPIGATEVLRTVKDDKNSRLLIIINDNYADGRDVSWLWDANFELLTSHNKQIITSGVRASDMAVRLKYAGIASQNIKIIEDIEEAIKYSVNEVNDSEKLYILPTYTALLKMQKILKKFH